MPLIPRDRYPDTDNTLSTYTLFGELKLVRNLVAEAIAERDDARTWARRMKRRNDKLEQYLKQNTETDTRLKLVKMKRERDELVGALRGIRDLDHKTLIAYEWWEVPTAVTSIVEEALAKADKL